MRSVSLEAVSSGSLSVQRVGNSLSWISDARVNRLAVPSPSLISRRGDRLRIALCVSGQMRGFKAAFPTWSDSLALGQVDHDIFVHTWDRVGRKKLTPHHASRNFPENFAQVFSAEWRRFGDGFVGRYPELFSLFERQEKLVQSDVNDLMSPAGLVVDTDDIFPDSTPNVYRMHYKMERSYDLATLSGGQYDLFVRLRPDKMFLKDDSFDWGRVYSDVIRERVIFSDIAPFIGVPHGLVMGDQFLIVDQVAAPAMFRLWSLHASLTQSALGGQVSFQEFGGILRQHYSLALMCHFAGRRVERFPYRIFAPGDGLTDPERIPMDRVLTALLVDVAERGDDGDRRLLLAAQEAVALG